jgi:hypothetical protein
MGWGHQTSFPELPKKDESGQDLGLSFDDPTSKVLLPWLPPPIQFQFRFFRGCQLSFNLFFKILPKIFVKKFRSRCGVFFFAPQLSLLNKFLAPLLQATSSCRLVTSIGPGCPTWVLRRFIKIFFSHFSFSFPNDSMWHRLG